MLITINLYYLAIGLYLCASAVYTIKWYSVEVGLWDDKLKLVIALGIVSILWLPLALYKGIVEIYDVY